MRSRVVSIGYEGRSPNELVALLLAHHVRKVIDIRELPLSRRKGFSKTPLSLTLSAAGIIYQHLRAAGNPHRHLKADTAACLALYAQHLVNHPDIVDLVASTLHGGPVALLCFERHHDACHRSRLIEAIDRAGGAPLRIVRIE